MLGGAEFEIEIQFFWCLARAITTKKIAAKSPKVFIEFYWSLLKIRQILFTKWLQLWRVMGVFTYSRYSQVGYLK